jgi:rod shape-determining protein MreC
MTVTVRQTAVLALMFVAVSISLIMLDGRNKLDGLKGLGSEVVSPISAALTNLGERVGGGDGASDSQLGKQLADVTAERDRLAAENAFLREQLQDMQALQEQLKIQQERPDLTFLQADVIARDPQSEEKFLIVNRGSDDGVKVGQAVVSPNFLVGQVVEVEPGRAKVLLAIDSGFQIGAKLQTSQAEGIVYGRWQAGGRLEIRHLPVDIQVDPQQELVVTSNKTARVPEGLIVGKVMQVERDELQNEAEAEVLPVVDFDDLSSVAIIINYGEP